MKELSYILLSCIIFSCNSGESQNKEDKFDGLFIENERNKGRLQEMEKQLNMTKYVWTVIEHKRGEYTTYSTNGRTGFTGPLSNYIFYSDVIKVDEYNQDKDYMLQDNLEKELRNQFGPSVHSIKNRKTFVFDSYKDASMYRFSFYELDFKSS